jgi:multiple antibiotic resistance protein
MIGIAQVFTLFFVTLGPFKVLGPFVQRTHGLDDTTVRQIAVWAFAIATVTAVTGGLVGRTLVVQWGISQPALLLAAGVIFFLVALRQLMEQYEPARPAAHEPLPPSAVIAASRLVFPMLLTPYGIAAIIALLSSSSDSERTLRILGLVVLVMVLNLVAMLTARRILIGLAIMVLQVIGAVLAVLQVAMSVQFILTGLQRLGVIAG